jgi:UDP-N-acetylenolpyruvoylglucosamine reductase
VSKPASTMAWSGNDASSMMADLAGRLSPGTAVRANEPLAKRTTLRVGGPADLYVEPGSEADLAAVLRFCRERKVPFFLLGRGSNLLVRDGGFRGVVICLAHPQFSRIESDGPLLRCAAGARLKAVAAEAKQRGLAGFEFLEGIPGTVGGALRMNAGAMGGAIFDLVQTVRLMDFDGVAREVNAGEMQVNYRCCTTLRTHVALGAALQGKPDSAAAIAERMRQFSQKRWSSQPAAPSAGCIFKNALTIPAGKLIEELGLKGTRVGGASVSAEHGNFIITDNTATSRDVLGLIELIRARARTERSIELETEVEIIGECLEN